MYERGVSKEMVETVISTAAPFQYIHGGAPKTAYYDPLRRILVTLAGETITTVMIGVSDGYVASLKSRKS